MKTNKLGSLDVSVLGIGCNNFGMKNDEAESIKVVHASLDAGINFFDTADIYGGTLSETYLGAALRDRRDQAIVATKFGMQVDESRKGAHPEYIKQAVEDSLQRLQMDYIDLYQLHTPDDSVPIADTLGALNDLVVAGKVKEIGCSNFSAEQLHEANQAAGAGAKFISVQNEYSLLFRGDEAEIFPACADLGIGYLPYFPLANGMLTGKYRKGQPFPGGSRLESNEMFKQYYGHYFAEEVLDKVEALISYAGDHGHSILELALAWLLAQDVVPSFTVGASSADQAVANAKAVNWDLSAEQVQEISQLAPAA